MTYHLGLLDKSPLDTNETAVDALARSVRFARQAEELGYRRVWVAEHHNSAQLACPAPEILIAHLLAHTRHIRIGSGGVMLQHYSPYKVAENFNLLAALAPGRVDIGVGKAPGGLPLSTRALQPHHDDANRPDFDALLAQLNDYLSRTTTPATAITPADTTTETRSDTTFNAALLPTPLPPEPAQRFLLGASIASAELAAKLGWSLVYAAHLNGAPAEIERVLDHYRQLSGRPALLALAAIVSEDAADAARQAEAQQRFHIHVEGGQGVNVGSLAQAENFVRQAGGPAGRHRIEQREVLVLHGTGSTVAEELDALQARYGVEEFIIDTPITHGQARLDSIRLLAQARAALPA